MENSKSVIFVFLITIATLIRSAINLCKGNVEVVCKDSERETLLRFKEDLKDPKNRLSDWVGEGDCCSWTGIACDNLSGHVRRLHLGNPYKHDPENEADSEAYVGYKLGGKINPSLLSLNYLTCLNLSHNDFEGIPIPSFIGSFKSLIKLDLSEAGFVGVIPHQLGNLSSLRYLNLRSFEFDMKAEKLQWISGLSSLQYLDMSQVDLSNADDGLHVLSMLPSLVELRLSDCGLGLTSLDPSTLNFTSLATLDPSTLNFTSLATLDVSNNHIYKPNWLFSLTNLHSLYLGGNYLGGPIPFALTNMTRLKILDLSNIYLNSTIPQWLCEFDNLESLDLGENELEGKIPNVIGNLTSIISLDLGSNHLEGEIPKSLGNLCRLKQLQLQGNNFSGQVSEILETLSECAADLLESLVLDRNKLSGQLTNHLAQFKNLVTFSVRGNQLNGSLPESLGQLVRLKEFDISHNSMKGVVSEVHFANLTRLKYLYASENSLTLKTTPYWLPPFQCFIINLNSWNLGPKFPNWIRWQQSLESLQISNVGISDTIPLWFCNISSQLSHLNLSLNQFYGEYPCTAYSLSVVDLSSNKFNGSAPLVSSIIEFLDFSNNFFSGSLYNFFCDIYDTKKQWFFDHRYILMGNNSFSGAIPKCLKKWKDLVILHLENNNLSGSIPSSIGYGTGLASLHLRNNRLSGELPLSLQKCTGLNFLDLGNNKFNGKIPQWIGSSFSRLMVLNLRSNKFQADIPLELCNLRRLFILDLAHNNISGTVPRCFSNFTTMSHIQYESSFEYIQLGEYIKMEDAVLVLKGKEVKYSTVLKLVMSIDLSANILSGQIPMEITRLLYLGSLNLSYNHLSGKIPSKIGDMRMLESLDLSRNQLSGEIPSSITNLTFLSALNLSYNNFSGRIPTSTQLQSLDEYDFIGNQLCGPPLLQQNCSVTTQAIPPGAHEEDGDRQGNLLNQAIRVTCISAWVLDLPLIFGACSVRCSSTCHGAFPVEGWLIELCSKFMVPLLIISCKIKYV